MIIPDWIPPAVKPNENLAINSSWNESPTKTSNQKIIDGTAKNNMARLQPNNDDKPPKMNVPTIEPRLEIEPSHEICSFVIWPVSNGVSSDNRTFNAGLNHPAHEPCPISTVFAKNMRKITVIS